MLTHSMQLKPIDILWTSLWKNLGKARMPSLASLKKMIILFIIISLASHGRRVLRFSSATCFSLLLPICKQHHALELRWCGWRKWLISFKEVLIVIVYCYLVLSITFHFVQTNYITIYLNYINNKYIHKQTQMLIFIKSLTSTLVCIPNQFIFYTSYT